MTGRLDAALSPTPIPRQAWHVLIVSSLAFTVCFRVRMMFGVIGIPLNKTLSLNATELGLFVGLAGGSFSVGMPYVARWFNLNRQTSCA